MSAESATVSFRTESGVAEGESWTVVDSAVLSNIVPWRADVPLAQGPEALLGYVLERDHARPCRLRVAP